MPPDSDGHEPELTLQIHDDAFTDQWLETLSAWTEREVSGRRLPSDFSADCIQNLLLQVLESQNGHSKTRFHAITARIWTAAVKRAVLEEYAKQHSSALTIEDAERLLERSRGNDWLRRHFSTKREADARPSDAELDAADARRKSRVTAAMKILKERLTPTEMGLLRLHYMTLVPGLDRCYRIKEIAPILGKDYGYLRKIHPKTLQKVRHLLAGIIEGRPLR